ncbi:MAG TPA: flagellar hook-basal body complex protein FliE [Rhizobiaceae bacterium]|nr:flagellar hook-basal body complex protein FliE [Rhizobiaceae bacterium]
MIAGIGALNGQITGGGLTENVAGAAGAASGVGASFASMLEQAATNTVGALQNAEQMSVKALSGDVQTREVVDAVMSAEQSLQAAIAIRDKIVTAYLEVSRMAI